MATEDFGTRRWFRERLKALGRQYPELKAPERQEQLKAELARQEEEEHDHGLQTDWQARRQAQNEGLHDHLPQDTHDLT